MMLFAHSPSGVVSTGTVSAAGSERRDYEYDGFGRLTAARSSTGGIRSFRVDYGRRDTVLYVGPSGSDVEFEFHSEPAGVVQVSNGRTTIEAERDGNAVAVLRGLGRSVVFGRDRLGRIVETRYTDGRAERYFMDDLGFRTLIEYGGGGWLRLAADPTRTVVAVDGAVERGKGRHVGKEPLVGGIRTQAVHERRTATARSLRETTIPEPRSRNGNTYRAPALVRGTGWTLSDWLDWKARGQQAQSRILSREEPDPLQPDYGAVGFDSPLFAPVPRNPLTTGVPGLADALALASEAAALLGGHEGPVHAPFRLGSGPLGRPPEYRSIRTLSRPPGSATPESAMSDDGLAPVYGFFTSHCIDVGLPYRSAEEACRDPWVYSYIDLLGAARCNKCPDDDYVPPPPPPPPPTGLSGASISTEPGIAFIDRNLKMPTMKFTAEWTPSSVPVANVTFHWYLEMAFKKHRKNFTHRIPASGTKDVVGNAHWQPDWGGLLAGANELKVYVSATANGETTSTMSKTGFQIHGQNPSQIQIFSMAILDEVRAVAWKESDHRQFNATPYSGVGLPLYGSPDGWGLMQQDPLRSENQLWNWRTALVGGINHLMDNHREARTYLVEWHRRAANTEDTDDDWNWDPRTDHPERIWNDAFARYNTGDSIYSPNGNKGERNCSSTNGNPTGCSYSDTVRSYVSNRPW